MSGARQYRKRPPRHGTPAVRLLRYGVEGSSLPQKYMPRVNRQWGNSPTYPEARGASKRARTGICSPAQQENAAK